MVGEPGYIEPEALHGAEVRLGELAIAALGVQVAILEGMINAGVVNAKAMRAWLQSLVDQLNPLERVQPYGRCLAQVIAHLDAYLAGSRPLKLH